MKRRFLSILCAIAAPLCGFASSEGVPVYYPNSNANRNAYAKYKKYGYTDYVGNNGRKQVISSQQSSYKVPRYQPDFNRGAMTTNGISTAVSDYKTTIYAQYARRFADFEFTTGVNSILEWDDMVFN